MQIDRQCSAAVENDRHRSSEKECENQGHCRMYPVLHQPAVGKKRQMREWKQIRHTAKTCVKDWKYQPLRVRCVGAGCWQTMTPRQPAVIHRKYLR